MALDLRMEMDTGSSCKIFFLPMATKSAWLAHARLGLCITTKTKDGVGIGSTRSKVKLDDPSRLSSQISSQSTPDPTTVSKTINLTFFGSEWTTCLNIYGRPLPCLQSSCQRC